MLILDRLSKWLHALRERSGWQKACVALVNKNLRIAWALLTRGECFDPDLVPAKPAAKCKPVGMPTAAPAAAG